MEILIESLKKILSVVFMYTEGMKIAYSQINVLIVNLLNNKIGLILDSTRV